MCLKKDKKTDRKISVLVSYILQPKLSDTELLFSLYFLFQEPNPKRPKPKPGELLQYMFVSLRSDIKELQRVDHKHFAPSKEG